MSGGNTLPIVHTIFDPDGLRDLLRRHWGISASAIKLHACRSRDIYRIDNDAGRYALVISPASRSGHVPGELAALAAAAAAGIADPPVDGGSGPLAELPAPEGMRAAIVIPWAEGQRLDVDRNASDCAVPGQALAQLHAQPVPDGLPELALPDAGRMGERLERVAGMTADVVAVMEPLRARLATLGAYPKVCLHGDVDATNIFIVRGSSCRLIDFELAACGPRLYDVASLVAQLYAWPWPQRQDAAAAFLRGYRAEAEVGDAEWAALPVLAAWRLLAILEHHLERAAWRGLDTVTPRFASHLLRDARQLLEDAPGWISGGDQWQTRGWAQG